MFSFSNKEFNVVLSNFPKAALLGAKTVNGPSPCKADTKSAACKAVTKVEKSLFPTAASTIVPCAFTWKEKKALNNNTLNTLNFFMLVNF